MRAVRYRDLRLPIAPLLCGLALLAACAQPVTWHRAETPGYQTENDVNDCWLKANAAIPSEIVPFQQVPSFGVVPTPNGTHASAIVVPNPGPVGADASVLEQRRQFADRCMRERGYTAER
jgi:hypothetical protein